MELMERLIRAAVARGAQSIHFKARDVFRARIHGELVALSETPFTPEETRQIALSILPGETFRRRIDEIWDLDFAWELKDLARFRVNILQERGSFGIVLRTIPWRVPTLDELNLPQVLTEVADEPHGMVLVTGATGVGKSTTQAAMISWINHNRKKHIVTLEDPIEYWHDNHLSTVTQREVGSDTESFRSGLRQALRQDPDIILIGEMRDLETAEIAVEAAETGHLVVSTMHAPTTTGALKHLFGMFPDQHEELVRFRVADTLRAIVSQRLVRTADGGGSVPAIEILRNTPAVRDCILRGETKQEIIELMQNGREQYGMQTFDQNLMDLVEEGVVDYDRALAMASNPSDFELHMKTLREIDADSKPQGAGSEKDGITVGSSSETYRL
jgi:twitching motility protein PilT